MGAFGRAAFLDNAYVTMLTNHPLNTANVSGRQYTRLIKERGN